MNMKTIFFILSLLPKGVQKKKNYDRRFFLFATGVNNTGGAPWATNISANFRKNLKRP